MPRPSPLAGRVDAAKRRPGGVLRCDAPPGAQVRANLPLRGRDFSSPHQHDEIAAWRCAVIAIGAVGGWTEFEAIAGSEIVRLLALHEGEPAREHPDDVRHAVIRSC